MREWNEALLKHFYQKNKLVADLILIMGYFEA